MVQMKQRRGRMKGRRSGRKVMGSKKRREVATIAKQVVSRNMEQKASFHGATATVVNASGVTICLTEDITAGSGVQQRTGYRIKPVSLYLNFNLYVAGGGLLPADAYNDCRLLVWQLHGTEAATTLEAGTNGIGLVLIDHTGPAHLITTFNKGGTDFPGDQVGGVHGNHRITVLHDEVIQLGNALGTTSGGAITGGTARPQSIVKHLEWHNMRHVEFNGNDFDVARGHICVTVVSDSTYTPSPYITWDSMLRYRDA